MLGSVVPRAGHLSCTVSPARHLLHMRYQGPPWTLGSGSSRWVTDTHTGVSEGRSTLAALQGNAAPRGPLEMPEDIFGCHTRGWGATGI